MLCLNCSQSLEDCQCEVSSAEQLTRNGWRATEELRQLTDSAGNQAISVPEIKPEPVMYQLTKQTIKRIESMMSPNHIVEIAIEDGKLQLSLRPKQTDEIRIHPVCPCMDEDSQLFFYATKLGEPQVYLAQVKIEAGTWITGLKVARNEI